MSLYVEVLMLENILRSWRRDPMLPKRAYRSVAEWQVPSPRNDLPLTQEEVESMKRRLKELAPTAYAKLFSQDRPL